MTEICGFMKSSFRLRLLFILRDTAGKRACLHAHLPANAKSIRRGSLLIDYRRYGGSVGATVEISSDVYWRCALLNFKRALREMIPSPGGAHNLRGYYGRFGADGYCCPDGTAATADV